MKKLLILSALIAACSSGGGSEPEKELVYVEDTPPATGIHLRLMTLDDQSLTLEVVGKGITALYGLALRLQYDPEFLDFTEMTPATEWPTNTISIARKNPAGTLVAAITNRGPATGLDAQDQSLATLRFTLRNQGESAIDFITRNCALFDTTGAQLPNQSWSGGALELR